MTTSSSAAPVPVPLAVVIGSVRAQRTADALIPWLSERLRARSDVAPDLIDLADVPLDARTIGSGVSPIADRLAAAQAYCVLTPEYNHSFPGSLKDAIDAHVPQWRRKPVGFVGYGARRGGTHAVEQLRLVFAELGAMTVRDAPLIAEPWNHLDARGFTAPPGTNEALDAMLDELLWWARALQSARSGNPR